MLTIRRAQILRLKAFAHPTFSDLNPPLQVSVIVTEALQLLEQGMSLEEILTLHSLTLNGVLAN
jgi:hypothetical protein